MGNQKSKSKLEGASMNIVFEGDNRAFDANHQIVGTINVDTNQAIPAYGIMVKLELIDTSNMVISNGKTSVKYELKRRVFEKCEMAIHFENKLLNIGQSSFPFSFQVPADLPQTLYFAEKRCKLRCKLRYFFKAQLVPVNVNLLIDEYGKCKLRDRQRVHISPVRPIVNDPQFRILVPFAKKVGLIGDKMSNMQVTVSKNFFLAGEMAYLMVNIDNSACGDPCSLEISQNSMVQIVQSKFKRTDGLVRTHRKEQFFLVGPHEQKQMVIQFQIAAKRDKPPGISFHGKHAADYYQVSTLVPESMYAQTFSVINYLELYLTHTGTVFSNDSKKKFVFQLIQPSLVPGVIEPPPPIFLDTAGAIVNMDNPAIDIPAGEIIQGEAMDIGEEEKGSKGEEMDEAEEPYAAAQR